jgi:hypothetical protein
MSMAATRAAGLRKPSLIEVEAIAAGHTDLLRRERCR